MTTAFVSQVHRYAFLKYNKAGPHYLYVEKRPKINMTLKNLVIQTYALYLGRLQPTFQWSHFFKRYFDKRSSLLLQGEKFYKMCSDLVLFVATLKDEENKKINFNKFWFSSSR